MTDSGDGDARTLACQACGRLNHDTARFCQQCAAELRPATGASEGTPPDASPEVAGAPRRRRRTLILATALAVALLVVAGIAWLAAGGGGDDGPDTTSPPTTTAVTTPGTATTAAPPATTIAPPTTSAPAALTAPVLTSVTPTCDPAADADAPCTISVTWEHPGGADGFTVVATVQSGPVAGNSWVDDVGPDVRAAQIGPLATGLEECVKVIAHRAGATDAASPEQCVSTGIG